MGGRKRRRSMDAMKELDMANQVPASVREIVGPDRLVLPLQDFVVQYAPSLPPLDLNGCVDGDRIRRTLVCPSTNLHPLPKIQKPTHCQSLVDLVDDVIWTLVQRKSRDWSQRNVLDQGYSVSSGEKEVIRSCPNMRPGVICTHLDDNVNFCKLSSYAKGLYRMIGEELMRVLLLETTVFLPVMGSDSNFILLCGTTRYTTEWRDKKRMIRRIGKSSDERSEWKPNVFIPRQSLFYSQAYLPKIGFQTSHVMNQKDPKKLLRAIVSLYTSTRNKRRKRWIRLRDKAIPLCQRIINSHERFDYHRALNRACPLPSFVREGKSANVSLTEVATAHNSAQNVASFLKEVILGVFPIEFWGSSHNQIRVFSMLSTFVALRRFERFPKKELTGGLRVSDIRWMWTADNTKSSHEAATSLLREAMQWLVCGFAIPLLRSIFHVTESEFSANRVLYYRKPVWSIFRNLSITKLTSMQYREVSMHQAEIILNGQRMGLSRLKLLPKETGVRPIAMLSKRDTFDSNATKLDLLQPSTNSILANAFQVLRHEYKRKPERFGAGQAGLDGVYPVLKSFLKKVRNEQRPWSRRTAKELFFVSVDIQKCYDNVNQSHLLEIIERDIVQDDQYLIQHHTVLHPFHSLGRPVWKRVRIVGGLREYQQFHKLSARLSPQYTDSVFSNGIRCSMVKKRDLLMQLKEHLQSNLVAMPGRYGKRYFLQTSGIPQGSVLSSFLCNFYYGKLEHQILGDILQDCSECTLIRLMDDFIFITTNRNQAERFLARMKQGNPELGVKINSDKSLSNIENDAKASTGLVTIAGITFFPWCGLLIDTVTGEVRIDYSRFKTSKALDSLTIDRCQVGRNLEIRMKTFVRPRCQPILYDSNVNSFDVIICNFTQMMLLAALKTHEVIRSVVDTDKNIDFIRQAVDRTILFARNLIIHRMKQHFPEGFFLCLGQEDALWLGYAAFHKVFRRVDLMGQSLESRSTQKERIGRLGRAARQAIDDFMSIV